MDRELINATWLLGCTAAVLLMQAGFCCLETGQVRAKNSINVALKNVVDIASSALVFWLVGFALMFGDSVFGIVGKTGWMFNDESPSTAAFFLFQLVFCGTATTIVSGAVAERMKFWGYFLISLVVSGMIYPIAGHWVWGGLATGETTGWLAQLGFIDFAGSTVVHSVGGWIALAAVLVIGPRHGRFDNDQSNHHGHNVPVSALGVLILFVGWFGFNGGSTLAINAQVPQILINTMLGGAAGSVGGLLLSKWLTGRTDVYSAFNGLLAGLVAITANCHLVGSASAVCIGIIGGWIAVIATNGLVRLKIDDVIGAVPVHGFAGVWGTLAVALFADPNSFSGQSRWGQFLIQLTGVGAVFAWAFGAGIFVLWLVNRLVPLRVSLEAEKQGLNVSEHEASYELLDLLGEMEAQTLTGDFSCPTTVVSQTEVGQIAAQYNRVLETVSSERHNLIRAHQDVLEANQSMGLMRDTLQEKVAELEEFNGAAVGRELRMIELKSEINVLSEKLGLPVPHDLDFDEFSASGVQGGSNAIA